MDLYVKTKMHSFNGRVCATVRYSGWALGILKRFGLVKPRVRKTFPAGLEYRGKTTRMDEMWRTATSYPVVKNRGWYYPISVLDGFIRKTLLAFPAQHGHRCVQCVN